MQYIRFDTSESFDIALLIKYSACKEGELRQAYIKPLHDKQVPSNRIMACSLPYNRQGKIPLPYARDYLADILPILDSVGVTTLYVADAAYFKALTKLTKAEPYLGYVVPCKLAGFEHFKVILGVNHHSLLYNPANEEKLLLSLDTLVQDFNGKVPNLGENVLKDVSYPESLDEIKFALSDLHRKPELFIDIEAFSLNKHKAGIATIAFAWDEHSGIAFPCDYQDAGFEDLPYVGMKVPNEEVRALLKKFFFDYQGVMYWHRANYDLGVIIRTLWMKSVDDYTGLLEGLEIMCPEDRWHDTRLIAYLALNSCARQDLSLKSLGHRHAGNWAQSDINDVRKIPKQKLLEYNLIDAVCTAFVRNTYFRKVYEDKQESVYKELFIPAQKTIIHMELVGLPVNKTKIAQLRDLLSHKVNVATAVIEKHPAYAEATFIYQSRLAEAANKKLKKLRKTQEDFKDEALNVGSGQQLSLLLYEVIGLPVIETTDTGQPATGGEVLLNLMNHTKTQEVKDLLTALIDRGTASKILNTFIPAFEEAEELNEDFAMLQGSFNLGGTVSGRLSSSDPNLQNIPANSEFGKDVKKCFSATKGWIFVGADFNSLEDYISALTTKDPNKLRVYLDGYDGHSLRAFSYFRDKLPDIEDTVESVNSIKDKYPDLRQDSKGPTFALTYAGTWSTLVNNCGFSPEEAKKIEANYHELYKVSDAYIQKRLEQAMVDGYAEVAFGLKVRTPLLSQALKGISDKQGAIAAEGRTVGNAMGQSYGLLTNRAMNALMAKVWEHPEMRLKIQPAAMIHDALYFVVRDEAHVVKWLNDNLIEAMQWQELPEIQHDKVKLGAAVDLFWPSWADPITIKNYATQQEIISQVEAALTKRKASVT